MRKAISLAVLLLASLSLQAKTSRPTRRRTPADGFCFVRLREKDGKTLAGQIFGTDGQHKKTQETLCQEYVLRSQRVTYRIGRKMTNTRRFFRSARLPNFAFTKTSCCCAFRNRTARKESTSWSP